MLYLTRTTNKVRKTKNIQLAIFQIPLINLERNAKTFELNFDGYSSIHPTISSDGKFCISQVIVLEDMVVWIFTTST